MRYFDIPQRIFGGKPGPQANLHVLIHSAVVVVAMLLTAALWSSETMAQVPEDLTLDRDAMVIEIVDGDTVLLDDGSEVRLVGLQAPKLSLGRRGFIDWPLASESKDKLADLTLGETVTLAYGGLEIDRHGRDLAHLIRQRDHLWIQGAMLEAGMARVYTFADNRAAIEAMLDKERLARADGRGIWALDWYAIRTPDQAGSEIDSFQIVEGVVVAVRRLRNGRVFLNFASDWQTTLSATISPRAVALFDEAGVELDAVEGRPVRLRGWIYHHNGPSIELSHPEQLEFPIQPGWAP
jgi:micrococcal nuclease